MQDKEIFMLLSDANKLIKNVVYVNQSTEYISLLFKQNVKKAKFFVSSSIQNNIFEISQLYGTNITRSRYDKLFSGAIKPANSTESALLNYAKLIKTVFLNYKDITIDISTIEFFYNKISEGLKTNSLLKAYRKTRFTNYFNISSKKGDRYEGVKANEIKNKLREICAEYNAELAANPDLKLFIIPRFIAQFIYVSPFIRFNYIIAILLIHTCLLKEGYAISRVGKLDEFLNRNKAKMETTLVDIQKNLNAGNDSTIEFIKFFTEILAKTYADFRVQISAIDAGKKAVDVVKKQIKNKFKVFAKREIMKECPYFSKITIERTLAKLVKENFILIRKQGKSTRYLVNETSV